MSAESHADHDEHAGHDEDHEQDELDSDEPRTPGWLTLLGVALFLLAGIFVIATDEGPKNLVSPEPANQAPAEAAAAATAQVAAPPAPPPQPGQVDPQQARGAAQRLIDQLKLRGAPGGPGAGGPGAGGPGAGRPGGGRGDGSGRGQGTGRGMGHGPGDGHGH